MRRAGLRRLPDPGCRRRRIIPARAGFTARPRRRASSRRDHPRSRGVYARTTRTTTCGSGSSPLARGLLSVSESLGELLGIIPARAGFTRRRDARPHPQADHPRSRGVYAIEVRAPYHPDGSSPLARGLRPDAGADHGGARIIPARAGFTVPAGTPDTDARGSSPLARGLLDARTQRENKARIIPARAGFTRRCGAGSPRCPDHPRSRGVYRMAYLALRTGDGSSPLARGLHRYVSATACARRIIPARAGFTTNPHRPRGNFKDHPRSRGVYVPPTRPGTTPAGSSPLARGLLGTKDRPILGYRIIPARAGFTSTPRPKVSSAGDHPRSRGVYLDILKNVIAKDGSSPLARGLRARCRSHRSQFRIIPARAGFTPTVSPNRADR